ncbi:MAG: YhfC family glutamic-type intramembrane protease [Promethearchaeota archaeon]
MIPFTSYRFLAKDNAVDELGVEMSLLFILVAIVCSLIAILPAFLIFLYVARFKGSMWISALLGGVFWFLALLAREPILIILQLGLLPLLSSFYVVLIVILFFLGALMAGLFEEGIKYGFLRKYPAFVKTVKHALCFGLGWGLSEAILLYVVTVLTYGFLYEWLATIVTLPSESQMIFSFILGAFERNTAIVLHVSATILVALAVWHKRFLFAFGAILSHFLFDFIPIMILQFVLYPFLDPILAGILAEVLIAVFAIIFLILAYWLLKREGGPPEIELEPPSEDKTQVRLDT